MQVQGAVGTAKAPVVSMVIPAVIVMVQESGCSSLTAVAVGGADISLSTNAFCAMAQVMNFRCLS